MQINGIKVHRSITEDRIVESVQNRTSNLENPGFCIKCGEDAFDCEPDAREYPCEECEANTVYGDEELLMMGVG